MSNSSTNSGGSLFLTGLLLLFIGLKLAGVINWSWWYVMAPLWAPVALIIAIAPPFYIYEKRKRSKKLRDQMNQWNKN